jgi:parvulin-like peptidyl-prolyl isomerase
MKPLRALTLISVVLVAAAARGEIIERVIVKVNGDVVTQSEFEARQIAAVQAARIGPEQVEKFLRDNNAHILQEAIDDLLLVQRAVDLGIKLRPEYIKEVIDGIKKENNITSDEDLQAQLKREGMTLEELKRNIERNILKRQVMQKELESKVTVTEDDAKAWYEANKADYTKAATVHLQQLVVRADGKNPALAVDLVSRARAGEDLAELAKAYAGPPTRATVSDLGVLRKGDLAPAMETIAFALAPGQISEAIPTPEGFRILKLVEKTEGSVVPYEDARAEIQRRLTQARGNEQVEKYLVGLREKAIVDLRVREVPLQLTGPAPAGTTRLDAAAEAGANAAAGAATDAPAAAAPPAVAGPPAPANPDEEITTTPQAQPERVAPPSTDAPSPVPTPTPTPKPTPPPPPTPW